MARKSRRSRSTRKHRIGNMPVNATVAVKQNEYSPMMLTNLSTASTMLGISNNAVPSYNVRTRRARRRQL